MNNINQQICSGCGGCVELCPTGCISLQQTTEGFYKAVADEKKCVGCGLCIQKCSMAKVPGEQKPLACYAGYSSDDMLRHVSSSGGVFSALAKTVLDQGGAVFGAAFDENMHLKHMCAETLGQLETLRGSKYLQSDIREIYASVKQKLKTGRQVMFVGTPCQVAGLRSALGRCYDNLIACDLVCHGAPSAGLFEGYLSFLEKKYGGKIIGYDFRSKDQANDRMSYTVKLTILRRQKMIIRYINGDEDPYTMRFISGALQAQSCYSCPYTSLDRMGDITLADYWGYEIAHPELESIRGVSLILVNTAVGKELLNNTDNLRLIPTNKEKYLVRNTHLSTPAKKHPQRDVIYDAFAANGFTRAFFEKTFLPDGYRMYILKRRVKSTLR